MTDKSSNQDNHSLFNGLGGKAYLFGWNPIKWKWEGLDKDIETLSKTGKLEDNWSVVSHKTIQPGDRAYIVRLGVEPRGIFASGIVATKPYPAERNGRSYYRIGISLEVLLNPDRQPILGMDKLKSGNLAEQNWTPQASGISIRPQIADELEAAWHSFLDKHNLIDL
ncbi:MAG TPA: hypothetical protein VIM55_00500 [Mucilaginibacter sp.]